MKNNIAPHPINIRPFGANRIIDHLIDLRRVDQLQRYTLHSQNTCIEAPLNKIPSQRRLSQRGYIDGGVAYLLTPIIFAFGVLIIFALIASLTIPTVWLKGKWRIAAASCVLIFWGHLYWDKVQKPKNFTKWKLAAWAQCDIEQKKLPQTIAVDGFLDEGAAIRKDSLFRLFSERHLKFVEVKIRPDPEAVARAAYPNGYPEGVWAVPNITTSYVRLELGQKGDPACADLPFGISDRADLAPLLPDTCITLKPQKSPTAHYSLTLRPSTAPEPSQYGSWAFINRESGEALAMLTSVDTLSSITSGQISPKDAQPASDCRYPYTVILDRLSNSTKNVIDHESRILKVEHLKTDTDVASIDTTIASLVRLEPMIEKILYTEQESQELFNPEIWKPEWASSVTRAKERGFASYGSKLLIWPERKLIGLTPTAQANPYPWKVFAVENGFIVLQTFPYWNETAHNLVARYSSDGSLRWAIRIASKSGASNCSKFWPRAVYSTPTQLVFAGQCGYLRGDQIKEPGKTIRGEVWKVPLSALPGRL